MKKALKILIIIAIVIVLFFLIFPFPEGCFKEDDGELVLIVTVTYDQKSEDHVIEYNSIEPVEYIEDENSQTAQATYRLDGTNNELVIKIEECTDSMWINVNAYYLKTEKVAYRDTKRPNAKEPGVYTYNFSHPEWEEDKVIILEILEDNVEE